MRPTRFFAALAATALLFAACGDDASETSTEGAPDAEVDDNTHSNGSDDMTDATDEETSETGTPAEGTVVVVVAGGSVDGPGRVEAAAGDTVKVLLTSDVSDEVHVHGIDAKFAVVAGEPLEFDFVADIPGVYEVELESGATLLFELAVR